MAKIFKYIIGLCAVLLLNYTSASADEKGFDLIDVNTGHAVMKQSQHTGTHHLNTLSQRKKESSLLGSHRQNKKYRGGKHVSFDFYFKLPEDTPAAAPYTDLVFTPRIPKHYKYLFSREINPPPPKSC